MEFGANVSDGGGVVGSVHETPVPFVVATNPGEDVVWQKSGGVRMVYELGLWVVLSEKVNDVVCHGSVVGELVPVDVYGEEEIIVLWSCGMCEWRWNESCEPVLSIVVESFRVAPKGPAHGGHFPVDGEKSVLEAVFFLQCHEVGPMLCGFVGRYDRLCVGEDDEILPKVLRDLIPDLDVGEVCV